MYGYHKIDLIYTHALLASVNDRSKYIYGYPNYKYFGTIVSAYILSTLSVYVDVQCPIRGTQA